MNNEVKALGDYLESRGWSVWNANSVITSCPCCTKEIDMTDTYCKHCGEVIPEEAKHTSVHDDLQGAIDLIRKMGS